MNYSYTVKNVKTLNTHDGQALTATLYRSKVKVGAVEDSGHGGGMFAWIDKDEEREAFRVWIKELGTVTYPAGNGMPEFTVDHNEDSVLALLVTAYEEAQANAKLDQSAKKNLVYRYVDDSANSYRVAPRPATLLNTPLKQLLFIYKQKAPWFSKVTEVWVIGEGWKLVSSF